jgi:hypothetical protein
LPVIDWFSHDRQPADKLIEINMTMTKKIKNKRDYFTPVYRRLAQRIEAETAGVECATCESEVSFNHLNYWIYYTVTREYNIVYQGYDEEPDNRGKTFVTIHDYTVTDDNGDAVSSSFDPAEIEAMFDNNSQIDYRDER